MVLHSKIHFYLSLLAEKVISSQTIQNPCTKYISSFNLYQLKVKIIKKSLSDYKHKCISDTVVKLILVTAEASSSTSCPDLNSIMKSVDNVPGIRRSTKIFAFDTE